MLKKILYYYYYYYERMFVCQLKLAWNTFQASLAAMSFMAELQGANLTNLSWNFFWMSGKLFPSSYSRHANILSQGEYSPFFSL